MDIGNIATLDPRTAFHSPRRRQIVENCATSRVCRRCAGNTMILDTFPLHAETQTDKFGFGWHPFEPGLFGAGGRWTSGNAKSYFYPRIDAAPLTLKFISPFPSATRFHFLLSSYDPVSRVFSPEKSEDFYGEKDRMVELEIPTKLRKDSFYPVTIFSPTFSPREVYGTADTRRIGLAVVSLQLRGRPYEDLAVEDFTRRLKGAASGSGAPAYAFPILS